MDVSEPKFPTLNTTAQQSVLHLAKDYCYLVAMNDNATSPRNFYVLYLYSRQGYRVPPYGLGQELFHPLIVYLYDVLEYLLDQKRQLAHYRQAWTLLDFDRLLLYFKVLARSRLVPSDNLPEEADWQSPEPSIPLAGLDETMALRAVQILNELQIPEGYVTLYGRNMEVHRLSSPQVWHGFLPIRAQTETEHLLLAVKLASCQRVILE